jgi:hypothetical protein
VKFKFEIEEEGWKFVARFVGDFTLESRLVFKSKVTNFVYQLAHSGDRN